MSDSSPQISIIIPVYNASEFIEDRLQKLFSQQVDRIFEVLLVDDCSTDETSTLITELSKKEPRIRVFSQEHNQGPAAACNRGLQEAQGEYIVFLDADDYWNPGFLAKTCLFLDTHPDVVCVFTGQEHRTLSAQSSIEPKCLIRDNPPTQPIELEDFFAFWREQGAPPLCSGSLMVRGELLRRIGGQRAEFRICEDLEYWCYIALYGKMGFIPEILFVSDGARGADLQVKLTRRQRLERYRPRWHNARPMSEWSARLYATQFPIVSTDSFQYVMGDIASILIYSMIQDRRWKEALQDFRTYQKWLPRNAITKLLSKFCGARLTWNLACAVLYIRERLKK